MHSIKAEPYTVSLIIRGPSVKERFLVADKSTGKSWWQYGAVDESEEEKNAKKMTSERFESTMRKLEELKLFNDHA